MFLLPPSIADWLDEDHLAWFVIDAVDQMDLGPFLAAYRADGRGGAAYHPRTMLSLLVYAYAIGELSSRRIERACQTDIAFRVITGNQAPDHTVIARFRQTHSDRFAHVFTQVLMLCAQAGMASVGTIAIDGTKLTAAASLSANRGREQVESVVAGLLTQAGQIDRAEDAAHGEDRRGDEPPAVLRGRAARRARFLAAKKALDDRDAHEDAQFAELMAERARVEEQTGKKITGRKPVHPRDRKRKDAKPRRVNTTDPDSAIMPRRGGGFLQGWNAQAVVNDAQIFLAAEVTGDTGDTAQLRPMLDAVTTELTTAQIPAPTHDTRALADAGYASEDNFAALTDNDPDCYIATRNMTRNPEPRLGTRGPIPKNATLVQRMDRKVSTTTGRRIYGQRQAIIEPCFGHIKHARRITHIPRRGKAAATAEWKLITATHNLLKLFTNPARTPTPA